MDNTKNGEGAKKMCEQIKSFQDLPKIIAVDFDGALVSDAWPGIGKPNTKLFEMLKYLRTIGVKIVLWTSRNITEPYGDLVQQAVDFCKQHGLEFDAVNENIKEVLELTGQDTRKVYADLYIDDKSFSQQCSSSDLSKALNLSLQDSLFMLDICIKAERG